MADNVVNIRIRKFDVEKMRVNKTIYIEGPQYSGKSHLLKNLLYYINNPFCLLINPNEFASNGFLNILPTQCKQGELTADIMEKFVGRQKMLMEFNKRHKRSLDSHACLIMDNCVPDLIALKWDKNKHFKFLFQSGKEAQVTSIFTSPYPLKMPAHYYTSIDYVFILRETNKAHQRQLFNMFGGMFDSLEQFTDMLNQCTVNYGCLVIDRTKMSGKLSDVVFWYRAPRKERTFYLGSTNLWKTCYGKSVTIDDLLTKPLIMYSKTK